jgi:hypothetical protein
VCRITFQGLEGKNSLDEMLPRRGAGTPAMKAVMTGEKGCDGQGAYPMRIGENKMFGQQNRTP